MAQPQNYSGLRVIITVDPTAEPFHANITISGYWQFPPEVNERMISNSFSLHFGCYL